MIYQGVLRLNLESTTAAHKLRTKKATASLNPQAALSTICLMSGIWICTSKASLMSSTQAVVTQCNNTVDQLRAKIHGSVRIHLLLASTTVRVMPFLNAAPACAQPGVREHPSDIVYGEGGYEGHNTDDAISHGGANVWYVYLLVLCGPAQVSFDITSSHFVLQDPKLFNVCHWAQT